MFKRSKGKTIIAGFHGIGMVGFIAVDYLIKKLEAKRIDWMHKKYMPAVVFVTKKGIEMPVELYEHKNLLFLKVNIVLEKEEMNEFLNHIFKQLKDSKPKQFIVIGGLATTEKSVYGVANSKGEKLLETFEVNKFPKEITVFGPMAASLIEGEKSKIPVICILPNATANLPDPEAASRAIKKLSKSFDFEVDVSELQKEAKKIEDRLKDMEDNDEMTERMFV
ncbi:MAG: proteasome assembly chaperone family protein [Candidatus Altiarchaeota archaeon]|nr:proteasome assembly chaperone family protein [Candidatus Altiarchaeota archaeon]